LEAVDIFSKNPQVSIFIKICPVGTELYRADERTEGHNKANSRFSQLCQSA